ncbi:hypothetical protein OG559_11850 [Micromonospora sp. NBC_01405]|uniref:hypothetical protein n=1 Tax=Micromonospora sp. NBC_01405 TaxID=2903589 RepID=UPI003255ECB6
MTAGGFREVDHDLLADYLGGALDSTPDEAVVARLVEQDPAWAEAHDALVPALARVGEDLAAWAGPAPEMPLAVADRIAAALAGAGPGTPTANPTTVPDATDRTGPDHATHVPAALVPTQPSGGSRRAAGGSGPTTGRTGTAGPGRRGRRWARIAGPVALATASVFAIGLGLNRFVTETTQSDSASTTAAGAARGAQDSFRAAGTPQRSGTDWTPEALATGATKATGVPPTGPAKSLGQGSAGPPAVGGERLPAADGLYRLTTRSALDSCLAAVSTEHGAGPLTVDLVDYARFRGDPALVVRFVDPSGARWAWVSGPECGVPGSGADTRYRARVG